MSKDDVRLELTQAGLIISGERKRKQDDWREGVYWSERFCRSFMRTIPIPDETHVAKATATFENEILTVLLPVRSSGPVHRLAARMWADLERAEALRIKIRKLMAYSMNSKRISLHLPALYVFPYH